MPPQRILITGVSNPLGAAVARRLAPQVPFLFGCDVSDPISALEEMDFVHADTRLSVIGKLVRQLHIDTVVHLAVMVDSPREERSIHETDVIGTMNVLVGCASPSPVRKLVVKSSQAIYGAGPSDPSFYSEDMANWDRYASGVTRDLLEMEQLVGEFALRSEACSVTALRLGYRVSDDTSLAKYISLPVVPTFAGFDPRLQLLHEDDAVEAIVRSVVEDHAGVFNVAGDGVVLLSQAIGIMGGRNAPILPPYGRSFSRLGLRALAGIDMPAHLADLLAYGCVVDCSRLGAEFGWRPAYSSRQTMDALARGRQMEQIEPPSPPQEYELQVYLQQRRRRARLLN
ncbi:MAG TPA: NAD-dependent epimerase/dehydratase family protein [Candidatus Dormibacteraeota bacterium]|nr:NAD-dependent epimerase/dehydratase family protein [Candidatus Dormibacteraeota bacterium]HEV2477956.1 NAD-dependent epimerase/dehydratase family protein [Candidatus Dormibacteraeota bacterium]